MPSNKLTDQLATEQEKILFKTSSVPVVLSLGMAYLLSWYLHAELTPASVKLWLVVFTLIAFFRIWVRYTALQTVRHGDRQRSYYWLFVLGTALAGACWGVAAFVLFPKTPTMQTIFIASITGISAASVSALCSSWISVAPFLTLTILPLSIRLFLSQEQDHIILGGLTFIFLVVCLVAAKKLHNSIKENILLRLQTVEAEKQIQHREWYDDLTGLPNRKLLQELLDQELARATRHKQTGALLLLDIDHFKTVNDSLGHNAGDALLREAAQRIKKALRKEDVTARLGGDEFAILLPQLASSQSAGAQKAQLVAAKITEFLSRPFQIRGQEIGLTQSIGISLYPEQDKTIEDILKQADTAMNQAKTSGRNNVQFFEPDMQQAADTRLQLHTDIKKAIENEEFSVYFQPQVQIDGTIVGAEGLIRWFHPERGMISPAMFIPVAEESALILDIGTCVLRKVCAAIKSWEDEFLLPDDFSIAVNISAQEFGVPDFVEKIANTLREFAISPNHLGIELTEGSLISSVSDTVQKIEALRDLGIKFSVDDFGTGYSSLSYLQRLPLHTLKIDRSFVRDIRSKEDTVPLVEIIITLARNLGMDIVAEGVETTVELEYLSARGCTVYQGYYFYKPLPIAEFTELLGNKTQGKA